MFILQDQLIYYSAKHGFLCFSYHLGKPWCPIVSDFLNEKFPLPIIFGHLVAISRQVKTQPE
jgi:hypothetical protein